MGTYLEDNAQKLMVENIAKNLSDADEYPAMISMQQRCVSILAHLWNVQKGEKAVCAVPLSQPIPPTRYIASRRQPKSNHERRKNHHLKNRLAAQPQAPRKPSSSAVSP